MLRKGIINLLIITSIVLGTFVILAQFNWVKILHIDKMPSINQNSTGEFLWERIEETLDLYPQKNKAQKKLDKLFKKLLNNNQIADTLYQIHLNKETVVNAFALPGGHIVVNTGLIDKCETEGELLSVIAHETAHLTKDHPMELLKREIGMSVISSLVLGNRNNHIISKVTKLVTSTAYQRGEELVADSLGLVYLTKSHINPNEFIDFQKRMKEKESEYADEMEIISTHPTWDNRISDLKKQIISSGMDTIESQPILTQQEWDALKAVAASSLENE